jgi:hypothetical protein
MFYFQAYGLKFRSTLILPGYQSVSAEQEGADAEIICGKVSPTGLKNPGEQGLFFQVAPQEIWFNVPGVARFLVQEGGRIVFEPRADSDEGFLRAFLSGPCLAALLMQRNLFVLTGSVLKVNDVAVAYLGGSCSGKSSLITTMMQRGYFLMSDGLCVVNQEGLVFPGPSHIELWNDCADSLHIPLDALQSIRAGYDKYRLPLEKLFYNHSLPLRDLYVLNPQKEPILRHKTLTGGEKINFLQKNIYNKTYLAGLQKNQLYFEYCARLARQTNITLVEFNALEFNIQAVSGCVQALQEGACHAN